MALPHFVNCIEFADVGMELLEAHHVLERGAGGFAELLDVADDDLRLHFRGRGEPRLTRIARRRWRKAIAIRRHKAGYEEEVSCPQRLRLPMQGRRDGGLDAALAGTAWFERQHVDLDLVVVGSDAMLG